MATRTTSKTTAAQTAAPATQVVVTSHPVLHKYLAALLHISIVLVTSVTAAFDQPFTLTSVIQIATLVAGSIVTYLVPLLGSGWQSAIKTGVGLLTAAVAALTPLLVNGSITPQNIFVVIGAVLAALGTELGVNVRVDSQKTA